MHYALISLNLAEGRGRSTTADQKRFFSIAFGSVRECQAVFELAEHAISSALKDQLDHLAASLWRLIARVR